MEKLVKQIEDSFAAFVADANAQITKGNKAAEIGRASCRERV